MSNHKANGTPSEEGAGAAGMTSGERDMLARLSSRLGRDIDRLGALRAVEDERHVLDELQGDVDRQLERARDAAIVCLVGSTGAGKSTLLNALVGRDVATEGVDRPTTSAPVIYRPADADIGPLVRDLPGEAPRVVSYDPDAAAPVGGASAFWRGQILIDAPDVNSVETVHRDLVGELARRSDVLVVTAHRQSIAELSAASFVDLFAGRRGMLFVLGRRDEMTDKTREQLVDQLAGLAAERWGSPGAAVLAISAREAKQDPGGGGLPELRARLGEIISEERLGGVRRRNAVGNVARVAAVFQDVASDVEPGFDRLESSLRDGATRWVGELVRAVDERLEVRRADLARMLWDDAAKVWDGPGGYALKVGGLSAIGLGAGAAVARRNPVLAAGLAVGSVAADRVRGAVRENRFESTSGLLPGTSEVEGLGTDAFVEARLAAEGLFVDAHAEAMAPRLEELDGHATRAVEEAWERLVRVELPRTAQRGVPRVLRWLVDLPVYALGVFLLYRVVLGFIQENYAGFDFLLSGAIIVLAWLFLARLMVRQRLSSRSAALLAEVRGDVEQRLGRAADAATSGRLRELDGLSGLLQDMGTVDRSWRSRLFGEQ